MQKVTPWNFLLVCLGVSSHHSNDRIDSLAFRISRRLVHQHEFPAIPCIGIWERAGGVRSFLEVWFAIAYIVCAIYSFPQKPMKNLFD